MALFGRKKTTVGLDIGSGLIKVAVVDHTKRGPELVRVTVTPLLADAIVEGEVMDYMPHADFDLLPEAERLESRLRFHSTLARLWICVPPTRDAASIRPG